MRRFLIVGIGILSIFGSVDSFAQELTQRIEGRIVDKISILPISGASVVLYESDKESELGTVTDSQGKFTFETLPLGRYILKVSHVGYQTFLIPEVLLTASREINLEIQLQVGILVLEEVEVEDRMAPVHINMLGKKPITVEQTLRYAATFFDPARLSTSFPGVATINDQNNNVVVRGNSPNGVAWRLEGVDVVNPNHLTNAGTFSDRPAQSGGSVNILSSQLLGTSNFLNGAFDATFGNALSGVFDMRYRKGSLEKTKYTLQASLLGLEFAAEGPFKNKTGSYIVNYRYSTIGLLSAMGVDLGDESITFQDLSFHVNGTSQKGFEWSVYGLGGNSRNEFIAEQDSTTWEYQKDSQNILFKGLMYGMGASVVIPISYNSSLLNTLMYSQLDSERDAYQLEADYNLIPLSYDDLDEEIVAWRSEYTIRLADSRTLSSGFQISHHYEAILTEFESSTFASGSGDSWLIQPFANFTDILSQKFSYNLGIRYLYHSYSKASTIEPRLGLKWHMNRNQSLDLRYGRHSRKQTAGNYFATLTDNLGNPYYPNQNLQFTKADHYVMGYNLYITELMRLSIEGYYQNLYDVPVSAGSLDSFSALNQIEGFVSTELENTGNGKNYGIDVSVEKTFSKDIYYQLNASIYESKYEGSDGVERDTRFNGNYAFNFTGGKEFNKIQMNGEKTFGVNFKVFFLGGFRDTPIDLTASEMEDRTVYQMDEAFTIKMKDYFRLDLRLAWTKNKTNYTRTVSLDIQNLTNMENIAYSYFDSEQQSIVTQNQLGIIPVLAYRVQF